MKRILKGLAAVSVVLGGLGIGAQAASAAEPVNFSESSVCNSTPAQSYGTRVCYDTSVGYFYIYSGPNTLATYFPSNSGYTGGSYLPSPWYYNQNLALVWVNSGGGVDDAFYDGASGTIKATFPNSGNAKYTIISPAAQYDSTQTVYVYGGNFNTLAWYINSAGYELMFTY